MASFSSRYMRERKKFCNWEPPEDSKKNFERFFFSREKWQECILRKVQIVVQVHEFFVGSSLDKVGMWIKFLEEAINWWKQKVLEIEVHSLSLRRIWRMRMMKLLNYLPQSRCIPMVARPLCLSSSQGIFHAKSSIKVYLFWSQHPLQIFIFRQISQTGEVELGLLCVGDAAPGPAVAVPPAAVRHRRRLVGHCRWFLVHSQEV